MLRKRNSSGRPAAPFVFGTARRSAACLPRSCAPATRCRLRYPRTLLSPSLLPVPHACLPHLQPCHPSPSPTPPRPLSRALPRHPTLTHLASGASPTPAAPPFALPRAVEMARCSPARESCHPSDLRICIKFEEAVPARLHAPCHFDSSRRMGHTTDEGGRWLPLVTATAFSHQPPSPLRSQMTFPESSNPRLNEILRNAA